MKYRSALPTIVTDAPLDKAAVAVEHLPDQPRLSIIIPVLNEAECLDQSLARLFAFPWMDQDCEVILSDGGSNDDSMRIAARYNCRIDHGTPGRACQMNRGARLARAPCLLFLHADTVLAENFTPQLLQAGEWGYFYLRLDHDSLPFRVIETAINWRSRLSRVAGGDQALFFNADFFRSLGGFPEIPLMEDVAVCKNARQRSQPVMLRPAVTSSSRRWLHHGVVKTVLLMWSLRLAYWLGVSPQRLHRIYYPQQG